MDIGGVDWVERENWRENFEIFIYNRKVGVSDQREVNLISLKSNDPPLEFPVPIYNKLRRNHLWVRKGEMKEFKDPYLAERRTLCFQSSAKVYEGVVE